MPKISELPLANELKDNDWIPVVQDGVNKKVAGTHFVTTAEYEEDRFTSEIDASNKTMYKIGEGDSLDLSESAYGGMFKSAILYGVTLVNTVVKNTKLTSSLGKDISIIPTDNTKKYLLKIRLNKVPEVTKDSDTQMALKIEYFDSNISGGYSYIQNKDFNVGYEYIAVINPISTGVRKSVNLWVPRFISGELDVDVLFIEYQDGMENWDLNYFDGMNSVKMPILTTTGKNLFKPFSLNNGSQTGGITITENQGNLYVNGTTTTTVDYYPTANKNELWRKINELPAGITLTLSNSLGLNNYFGVIRKGQTEVSWLSKLETRDGDIDRRCFIRFNQGRTYNNEVINIQLEQNTQATPFEPHKSNILQPLEPVELGKVGNVEDTMDWLTGDTVENTKCINDMSIFEWTKNTEENCERFTALVKDSTNSNDSNSVFIVCNKLQGVKWHESWNTTNTITCFGGTIRIHLPLGSTMDNFNELINGMEIRYQLATPITRKVDLTGQPIAFKNGHIIKSTSGDGLQNYGLTYKVPASRGAQITQNTQGIMTNANRITELKKKVASTFIEQKYDLIQATGTLNLNIDEVEEDALLVELINDLIDENVIDGLYDKVIAFRHNGMIGEVSYSSIINRLFPQQDTIIEEEV